MSDSVATKLTPSVPSGYPLPLSTPYAVSLSLPTWSDHSDYWLGGEKVFASCINTYPRLFPHPSVRELAYILAQAHGSDEEKCLPFPTRRAAEQCCEYLRARAINARCLSFTFSPQNEPGNRAFLLEKQDQRCNSLDMRFSIHIALFPADQAPHAHGFWNSVGFGISVRQANRYLSMLGRASTISASGSPTEDTSRCADGISAKEVLRKRIANGVQHFSPDATVKVAERDVFLFPSGMTAIWSAHQLALQVRPVGKSICFGSFYSTQTVLKEWGPGFHFFGHGSEAEIDSLEILLEEGRQCDSSKPPILALFTEFPANPLVWSPNLVRLRELADKYGFLIVVDDTIGGFVNVDVLPYADVIVTSLTKLFSGYADAIGGSLVLNPNGRHYVGLNAKMTSMFEDMLFDEDAICLERNSRDLYQRVQTIDVNTEAVGDLLRGRSVAGGTPNAAIKDVYYPKYITPENYERCRVKGPLIRSNSDACEADIIQHGGGGFGCLFSLTFTSVKASHAFFEALDCFKGLSFGMNITVACPFAVSSARLGWGGPYGIEDDMLRISVGLENMGLLLASFGNAADAAEAAISTKGL